MKTTMGYISVRVANNTNCWQRLEQLQRLLLTGMCSYIIPVENSVLISCRTKHTFPTWPSNSTPIHLSKRNEITGPQKYLNNNARKNSVIVTPNWKQPKCLWRGQWISKVWHIHATEYYSVSKGRKTWLMHVKWIFKRCWWKRAYTEEKVFGMIPLTWNSGKDKSNVTESGSIVVWARIGGGARAAWRGAQENFWGWWWDVL